MRIMYITSGLAQLYPHQYIDELIITALSALPHEKHIFRLRPHPGWEQELFQVVENFQPEYVFTIHGANMSWPVVTHIRNTGAKIGIWFVDDPYDVDESKQRLFGYDFIFTNEAECVPVYKRFGYTKVFYLALGTSPQHYFPDAPPPHYRSDICLVGSPFPRRVEILNFLSAHLPNQRFKVVGPEWRRYGLRATDLIEHHVPPDDIRRFYSGAQINLNIHRNANEQFASWHNLNTEMIPPHSPNNRTFDIAACRGFQLVDFRPVLPNFFDVNNEMAVFHDPHDLLNKVNFYLSHPHEMQRMAANAYQRAVNHHRFENRLAQMFDIAQDQILDERRHYSRPDVIAQGIFIKDDRPAVWFLVNGRRYLIPTEDVFNRLCSDWLRVKSLRREEVDQYPRGVALVV